MMYTVWQQNNDKISDNLLPWKMRKIFILFLGKKDSSNSKKKKKRVQHYENNHKVYHVFVTGLLYSCIKYIT